MKPEFDQPFSSFICPYDTITVTIDNVDYTATVERDFVSHIDDDDCHNIDQSVTGCDDEQQQHLLAARQAWFDNQWWYGQILVTAEKLGIDLEIHRSVASVAINYPDPDGGSSDNSPVNRIANELLAEAVEVTEEHIDDLIERIRY